MAIKHVKDFEFPAEFGFHGSTTEAHRSIPQRESGHKGPHHSGHEGVDAHKGDLYAHGGPIEESPRRAPKRQSPSDLSAKGVGPGDNTYAHGGDVHPHGHHVVHSESHEDGSTRHHHAHGGITVEHSDGHVSHHHHDGSPVAHKAEGGATHLHPNGHRVVKVEHHADGRIVHHHAHGGHSVHHSDGRITHHESDGAPIDRGMSHLGIEGYHDESEYVHRARGGGVHPDAAEDKAMIGKAFRQHDEHMHEGAHESLHLRRGGRAGMPMNRPPMNPINTPTPRNAMPGGQMGFGVEPSAEPDSAPPAMAHGGHHRGRR